MKNELTDIDKARRLIDLWYAGTTSRVEEEWLVNFFVAEPALPADLEDERGMFIALHDAASEPVTMPEECRIRVEKALKAEIRRESAWKRRRILWGAAACLLLVSGVTFMARHTGTGGGQQTVVLADSGKTHQETHASAENPTGNATAPADTSTLVSSHLKAPESMIANAGKKGKQASGSWHAATKPHTTLDYHHPVGETPAKTETSCDDAVYASAFTEEEQEMMARGYRVVANEEEARAVVGLVMAKMQENVVESVFVVDEAAYRLDKVISKPI